MRPKRLVAGAALIAAFAMVALPQVAGSRTPSPQRPVEAAAFQAVQLDPSTGGSETIYQLDPAARSANSLIEDATFSEPGRSSDAPAAKPALPNASAIVRTAIKPPSYSLYGLASWYDNGTTAVRLPRGTMVRICGAGGCVERRVTDYGPAAYFRPVRVADLMPGDFRAICGCGWFAGLTSVRVDVY
ncbi:MAG: hypothetical protein ACXWMX_00715 [Candidatus Limnocylindrales bacterium]